VWNAPCTLPDHSQTTLGPDSDGQAANAA
jgi:hypothetical protein